MMTKFLGAARRVQNWLCELSLLTVYTMASAVGLGLAIVPSQFFPRYESSVSFAPDRRATGGGIASLAAQYGLNVGPVTFALESPEFLEVLSRSRRLDSLLALRPVTSMTVPQGPTLLQFLELDGEELPVGLSLAREWLATHRQISLDPRTGIVSVRFTSDSAEMSFALANAQTGLLDSLFSDLRRSRSILEANYWDEVVAAGRRGVESAEDSLARFQARNRSIQSSPQLALEEDRLRRAVDFERSALVALVNGSASARLESQRDTPALLIVDGAAVAAWPTNRFRIRYVLVWVALVTMGLLALRTFRLPQPGNAEV